MAAKRDSSKLALSFALLFIGTLLILNSQKPPKALSASLEGEPVRMEGFNSINESAESLPKRLLIPGVNVDVEVKKASAVNGYWEVFEDTAGWGEGSGVSGQPGNQVIFAHARENLFLPLKGVSQEMKVYVLTNAGWFSYKITEIKEVFPNEVEVIAPTEDETLTLYTCSGFNDSKRLIVVAKRV